LVIDDAVELEKCYQFAVAVKMNKHMFFSCCPLTWSRMVQTLKESRVSWKRIS